VKQVLIVRNGTTGRFTPIADAMKARGWRGVVLNGPVGSAVEGWPHVQWQAKGPKTPSSLRPVNFFEEALCCGAAATVKAEQLKNAGFQPDLVIGHPGWGEMAFLREVYPDVPQIQVGEYYYHSRGADTDFDPEFPARTMEAKISTTSRNGVLAMSYAQADAIVAPTPFQASLIPEVYQPRVKVIHEGIDTAKASRREPKQLVGANGQPIDQSCPVISLVNRRFEPMRGFHVFMRMLPRLQELVPNAHVLLIGADDPHGIYGLAPRGGGTWKAAMLAEMQDKLDMERVHFIEPMSYESLLDVFSSVTAHVYYTYPFVLSWSLLDAMACEAVLVGSDTAPVRDVVRHGENGLLVDFFDTEALAQTLAQVCRDPQGHRALGEAARRTVVQDYDRAGTCMPAWMNLIDEVLS
jgi:glycosyltransferase involved in cell wall biosynthesis